MTQQSASLSPETIMAEFQKNGVTATNSATMLRFAAIANLPLSSQADSTIALSSIKRKVDSGGDSGLTCRPWRFRKRRHHRTVQPQTRKRRPS